MLFRKRILEPGKHVSPDGVVEATPERIARWVRMFNRMKRAGIKIPIPWGHQPDAVPQSPHEAEQHYQNQISRYNAGYLEKLEQAPDGGLDAVGYCPAVEIDDRGNLVYWSRFDDGTQKKCSIGEVSVGIDNWRDGKGRLWKDCIIHLALTPLPVWAGQPQFSRLSTSTTHQPLRLSTQTHTGTVARWVCSGGICRRVAMHRLSTARPRSTEEKRLLSLLRMGQPRADGQTKSGKYRWRDSDTGKVIGYTKTNRPPGSRKKTDKGKPKQSQRKLKAKPKSRRARAKGSPTPLGQAMAQKDHRALGRELAQTQTSEEFFAWLEQDQEKGIQQIDERNSLRGQIRQARQEIASLATARKDQVVRMARTAGEWITSIPGLARNCVDALGRAVETLGDGLITLGVQGLLGAWWGATVPFRWPFPMLLAFHPILVSAGSLALASTALGIAGATMSTAGGIIRGMVGRGPLREMLDDFRGQKQKASPGEKKAAAQALGKLPQEYAKELQKSQKKDKKLSLIRHPGNWLSGSVLMPEKLARVGL